MTDLADVLNIGTGTTTALVDRLQRDGLVERRHHASDRRRNVVQLAPAGIATITKLRTWLVDACAELPTDRLVDTAETLRFVAERLATRTQAG